MTSHHASDITFTLKRPRARARARGYNVGARTRGLSAHII